LKNALLFVFVVVFLVVGVAILVVDLIANKSLHVMNGAIGSGFCAVAALLALPVQVDEAFKTLGQYIPLVRGKLAP
jgi:hypothetical protein